MSFSFLFLRVYVRGDHGRYYFQDTFVLRTYHPTMVWHKVHLSFLILLTNYCSGDEPMVVLDARSDWRFAKNVSKR
jgi:hypothetical protein